MRLPRWPRRPRVTVNLDPVQLIVVNALLRKGPAPLSVLWAEVEMARPLPREMFNTAMADLVRQEVAVAGAMVEGGAPVLSLTPLGRRLRGKVPRESRAALAIYL
jgi:hypothetical protein